MKDLKISSIVRTIYQHESAIILISASSIIFVYPDQHIEYYPFPENCQIQTTGTEITENSIYLFNFWSTVKQINNLVRFDLKSKTYTPIAEGLPYLSPYISNGKVYAVFGGTIMNRQLNLYKLDNDTIRIIHTAAMEKDDLEIHHLLKTRTNEWFGTIIKKRLDRKTYHCCRFFIEDDTLRMEYLTQLHAPVRTIERWDENRLILGFQSYVSSLILDLKTLTLSPFPLEINAVTHILADREDNLWFSTETGIFKCSRFPFEFYQLNVGSHNEISGVLKDSRQNVWFSTSNNVFWRADKQGVLHKVPLTFDQYLPFRYYGRMGLCEDGRGRVFLPFDKYVAIYDIKKQNPDLLDIIPLNNSYASYYDAKTEAVYFGGQADSGTTNLNILHNNGNFTTHFYGFPYIMSICRDGNEKLRIGTLYGEAFFDEETQTVVHDSIKRPYKSVICMALDNQGTLWKGGWDGFYAEDKNGNNHQISDQITVFALNYHNRYMIFGIKNQLYILDLHTYYQDKTIHIRTFGYYDGFDVMECRQNGATIDHEGYVWVAGGDRVIRFHPDKIMEIAQLQPQTPLLSAVYYAGKNMEWKLATQSKTIMLENRDNNLRFDLLQASLSAPDKLGFRYRLDGYNNQWISSSESTIIFQNLPFGKYRLEVQSSVDDGKTWSETVFSSSITIKKPFLLTFFGLLLISLGIAGITAGIIYFTRKISIRKEEENRQIDQLKHRAVRAKFIPHFTGNVLNSINYLISKNPHSAQKYISDFADFSHLTLLNSDTLFRTLEEELTYTQLYLKLEKLRFEEKLEYEMCISPDIDTQLMVPTMILQTFCENAIKHGLRSKQEGGKIVIVGYTEGEFNVIAVEDSGIGRKAALLLRTEGTKEGLKIVQQQLEFFNKYKNSNAYLKIIDLTDEVEQPMGTRFELWIPK